ncbi:MAG TPA: hypothetical protein VGL53_00650 [Bryobacteraceae bacterium]
MADDLPAMKICAQLCVCVLVATALNAALPVPPSQHAAWPRPSGTIVPDYVVNVTGTLFSAGLADPRGGSYREVQLQIPDGDHKVVLTHAWIFPNGIAVAWDGLVYRIQASGPAADLDRDVATILSAHPWSFRALMRPADDPDPEKAAFWYAGGGQAPTAVALLLRLGRSDLAAEFWKTPEGAAVSCFGCPQEHEDDEASWRVTAARVWFGTAYSRLVAAFLRRDYPDAIDVGESLLEWQSRAPKMSFLAPVPALLADSKRRLQEPVRPPVDPSASPTNQAARIADWIERLEDVQGDKIAWPGPLEYSFDPVYSALKNEGETPVGSLLDAYAFDKRLTRTFDYSRPWQVDRTPVPVHDVVKHLLGEILGEARVRDSSPAELRNWWAKNQSSNRASRSFEILADDQAKPEQWLESADFLTARSEPHWFEPGRAVVDCDPEKPAPEMFGKELKSRQNPSVSALMLKRTASLVAIGSDLACSMAVKAAWWDAKTALPALQDAARLQSCRANPLVTIARLSLGVPGAAAEWSRELLDHREALPVEVEKLAPLWIFPDDPVLRQTAERIFTTQSAPWSLESRWRSVNSPLLANPIFRKAVFAALEDSKVVGTAVLQIDGGLLFSTQSGGGGSSEPGYDPRQAPPGEERPIRVMDLVAQELSSEGAPRFELDWSTGDKDTAIAALIEYLRAHETQIRAFPMHLADTSCPARLVYLSSPPKP